MSITNPGAETGNMTGWTTEYGSWFAQSAGGPPSGGHTGTYRFQAGAVASAAQYQDVTIPSDYYTDVDNGNVQAQLGYWWTTYVTPDYSLVGFEFLTAASESLGSVYDRWHTTYPAGGAWQEDGVISMIPSGSRAVRIWMRGFRVAGSNLDAYLDDFVLYLLDASSTVTFPTFVPLVNSLGNTGTGEWTTGSDAIPFTTGSNYAWTQTSWRWNTSTIGIGDTGSVYRDEDLSQYTRLSDYISAGLLTASVEMKHVEPSSTDQFGLGVWSYNGGSVIDKLDSHISDGWWQIVNYGYATASLGLDSNTTKVRLWARGRNTNSTDLNLYFEDLGLYLTASGDPPSGDVRVTQLGREVLYDESNVPQVWRTTQLGRQVLYDESNVPQVWRVTQIGRHVLFEEASPPPILMTLINVDKLIGLDRLVG